MLDSKLTFSEQQEILNGTAVLSTNIYDAGTPFGGIAATAVAPKLFEGEGHEVIVEVTAAANGIGTNKKDDFQIKAQVVAADDDALTTNAVVLAEVECAAIANAALPTALKPLVIKLHPANQTAAKRYYALKYDLTGTGTDEEQTPAALLTATVNGYIRGYGEHQTNMVP